MVPSSVRSRTLRLPRDKKVMLLNTTPRNLWRPKQIRPRTHDLDYRPLQRRIRTFLPKQHQIDLVPQNPKLNPTRTIPFLIIHFSLLPTHNPPPPCFKPSTTSWPQSPKPPSRYPLEPKMFQYRRHTPKGLQLRRILQYNGQLERPLSETMGRYNRPTAHYRGQPGE